jgi:hypothetical protein
MKPEPQVLFRPYLEYIKLDWAENYISPNYISLVYSTPNFCSGTQIGLQQIDPCSVFVNRPK